MNTTNGSAERTRPHDWFGDRQTIRPRGLRPRQIRDLVRYYMADTHLMPTSVLPLSPIVIPRRSYAEVFRAGRVLLDLLRRTVLGLAPTLRGRLDGLGTSAADYPLVVGDPFVEEEFAAAMARPDVIIGADGPRFIEFNPCGTPGGVIETHSWLRAWRAAYHRYGTAPFRSSDPVHARADFVADACDRLGVEPRAAWVTSMRDLPSRIAVKYFHLELERLHHRGISAELFTPEDLPHGLMDGDRLAFPIGVRCFTVPEWRELGIDIEPVRQALDAGCLLLPTQTCGLLDNKKALGLLSEGQPWMSAAERAFVERYVPWTRIVADRAVDWRGERVDLVKHLEAGQRAMVLKRGIGMKGEAVLVGRGCTAATWRRALDEAVRLGDSVAQEYVEPVACEVDLSWSDNDAGVVETYPVLGPFLFGDRPGGLWARFLTEGNEGVFTRSVYGSCENVVVAAA
ncbi:hypothetical protein [Microbispora sp. H10949]|uniref:hypothetical protein n=1 Tax=Microbispora sp. H10949 TaxID=2729111 RepID=UPI0015FF974E|nr:hypothetical protein [Microbispora sp. H10949]